MEKSPDGTYTNFGIANFGEIFVFCHSHACLPVGRKTGIKVPQNQKLQKTRAIGVIPESIRGGIFSFENRVNEHGHRAVAGYCEEHKHAANEECDPMKSRVNKYSK